MEDLKPTAVGTAHHLQFAKANSGPYILNFKEAGTSRHHFIENSLPLLQGCISKGQPHSGQNLDANVDAIINPKSNKVNGCPGRSALSPGAHHLNTLQAFANNSEVQNPKSDLSPSTNGQDTG
jgi:hypothetical protein